MVMYTLLYLKWITNKHLLYSTWNSAQCYEAAWMGGEFGAEWTHLYVWLSPIAQYKIGDDKGTLLQYSCLENPTDGGAWWAAVHGVARSRTRLSDFTFTFHFQALEEEMATHSSVLAGRIPGTEEPGVAQSQMQLKQLSSSSNTK